MSKLLIEDAKKQNEFQGRFMIFKNLNDNGERLIAIIGNDTGDMKVNINPYKKDLNVGDVIEAKAVNDRGIEINTYKKVEDVDVDDFLPSLPAEDLDRYVKELDELTQSSIHSEEGKQLNTYFFDNPAFMEKFQKGIGGLVQHHNYLGGLVEHTLNVMYLTKVYAERYHVKHKELAILAAKLHDIGKIVEYDTNGPFTVTMRGDMEGHIVIGLSMLEKAFEAGGALYSDEFKDRLRGIIVQHHGKVEYGSPKSANTPEAYIVNLADQADAVMNKIEKIKKETKEGTWSEYDRRIGTRLLF
ncbi:HD domain-containing protein [Vallitalea okinawensis]|uniref:HD domain-containing protein n=1 Tax=Vallitalea okinawensis TaxID=2078660 RepID=UPI000CFD968D|nr:HD domain-containing protein [Vallitalea okinawensis]